MYLTVVKFVARLDSFEWNQKVGMNNEHMGIWKKAAVTCNKATVENPDKYIQNHSTNLL